ncbi:MAG: hypothetical protein H7333_00360 [Bdellovibrionales bacterium]|nr:hypothetical protein [Oligoflexia bacterium]
MKTKLVLLAASFVLNHAVLAQTTSTSVTTSPASAEATNAGTNISVANDSSSAASKAVRPGVKYLGIMHGPGMTFSGAHQADGSDLLVDNRFKLLARIGANTEVGFEPRINTAFGNGHKIDAVAGAMRLFANFKHVYKDDIFDLTLTPRAVLPTRVKFHNEHGTVSPDLIASLDIAPKNSRFSFNTGSEYIQYFHTAGANAAFYNGATTAVVAPWLEVDYQMTEKSQFVVSYWPELVAQARQGTPLHADSNEIDIGANYEFVKGWVVNPYVAIEAFDMKSNARLDNMSANLLVVGTIL